MCLSLPLLASRPSIYGGRGYDRGSAVAGSDIVSAKRTQHAGTGATVWIRGKSLIAAPALDYREKPCRDCLGKRIRTKTITTMIRKHRQGGFGDIFPSRDPFMALDDEKD